ncbi:MAG: di-trans,poly-cis-decaprenylcistransferase [Proteobacteria bacterium]|jgi:undecaprenyl diphosphate synthase|nr:di-trans,poly-cis-decaprenylcistransferase [Pseudomonadota bacterium]
MTFLQKKSASVSAAEFSASIPRHVAIIMDGNGRWALDRGRTRVAGHKKGVDAVKEAIRFCRKNGITHLTLFAFSSENWSRPEREVATLMELFASALETQAKKLKDNGIRLKLVGDLTKFSKRIQRLAASAQAVTVDCDKMILNIAVNYGGQWDIVEAARKTFAHAQTEGVAFDEIIAQDLAANLALSQSPDPDLFIRTGGECRISNFMLWQLAYTELYFTDVLWPDFDSNEFSIALVAYQNRERRFGQTGQQVKTHVKIA